MLEFAVIGTVALGVATFWAKWGWRVMALGAALTPAKPAPARVTVRRPRRDGFEELLREAEWRDIESAEALTELKAEIAELERANRAV